MDDLNAADGRSIATFLRTLGRQPDDMLRLFDRKDYYTVHGRDADTVAIEYFKSSSCVKYYGTGEERQAFLSFNKRMGAEVIRTALLHQRRRVEVYKSAGNSWALERRGSPGNLHAFEDECERGAGSAGTAEAPPVIVAVRLGKTAGAKGYAGNQRLVGACFIDTSVRCIRTAEFEDDEQLSTLESLICQQGTREALVCAELGEAEKRNLTDVLELCEVPFTSAKKGSFSTSDVQQDLRRLLGTSELHGRCFESAQGLATSAACGLVRYLELMSRVETHGGWTLEWVDAAQFMRLDAGAMRALSVEPLPGEPDKNASLLGIFSNCKTAMGSRLLRKWLKQPLLSKFDIEERLDVVQVFATSFELRGELRDTVLPKMGGDLDRLGRKFSARKASLQDVVSLYRFVGQLPKLLDALREHEARSDHEQALVHRKFTQPLDLVLKNFTQFARLVETAVDLAAANRHEFVLQPHFSPQLRELEEEKEEVRESIEAHYEDLQSELGMDDSKLKLEIDPKHGHVLRVTRNDEKLIRNNKSIKGLTMLSTKKEGVLFQDRQLAGMADEYSRHAAAYESTQRNLVTKVVETTATFCPVVTDCHCLLAELDVLLCFAHVSVTAPEPYVRPTIVPPEDPQQGIVLKGCRHPCVERMDGVDFIKNDISLVRGESSLQIVTGPNMGGKSTYIRSAGVNVLLAQVGCFVACDEARISIADSILARVGAGDCQSRGVSTFMAEMLESATILKGATPSSLVIIDELGRGTSTYDGFGLAWAISSHLATKLGCACLFATHFQELTELADQSPLVVNRHVSAHFEDSRMTMLFKVEDGPSDQSFGINVAEVAGFPPSVIDAAKRKLAELEDFSSMDAAATAKAARHRPVISEDELVEGAAQVRSFLSEFAALPLDQMSEADALTALSKIQDQMSGSQNSLVAHLREAVQPQLAN